MGPNVKARFLLSKLTINGATFIGCIYYFFLLIFLSILGVSFQYSIGLICGGQLISKSTFNFEINIRFIPKHEYNQIKALKDLLFT